MTFANPIANRQSAIANPLVIIRSSGNRQNVVAASDEAAAAGIKPGMTVAQARALCASIDLVEHEPHRDVIALEAIARWMLRFTPIVALPTEAVPAELELFPTIQSRVVPMTCGEGGVKRGQPHTVRSTPIPKGEKLVFEGVNAHPRDQLRVRSDSAAQMEGRQSALYLDLTGCQYFFGGYQAIVDQIAAAMRRFGVRAHVVVAPTVGAAYALTFDPKWDGKIAGALNGEKTRPRAAIARQAAQLRKNAPTNANRLGCLNPSWGEGRIGASERSTAIVEDAGEGVATLSVEAAEHVEATARFEGHPSPYPLPQGEGDNSEADPHRNVADCSYLNHLPPITLRIDDDTAAALHHLGIATIGLLRRLPREQLPARFGPLLLKRLNQALGLEPELLVPIRPIEPIESGVEFDFGVDSIELLWDVIQEHLDRIIRQLIRRGHGVRRMQFDLLLQNAEPVSQTIELSRPSREPKRLFRLVRLTLEQIAQAHADNGTRRRGRQRPKTKARDLFGARFTGIHFRVLESLRIREDQIAFLEGEQVADEQAIADLIERLQLRLEQGVMQAALVESHVPEKRWEPAAPAVATAASTKRRRPATPGINAGTNQMPRAFDNVPIQRPLTLSPTPREIRVMVSPSHDRDGRPVAVTLDGQHHRVTCARGPERIAGQWWTGHHKTRDYFDIELDDAKRLWVFRVHENGRWFVHGDF